MFDPSHLLVVVVSGLLNFCRSFLCLHPDKSHFFANSFEDVYSMIASTRSRHRSNVFVTALPGVFLRELSTVCAKDVETQLLIYHDGYSANRRIYLHVESRFYMPRSKTRTVLVINRPFNDFIYGSRNVFQFRPRTLDLLTVRDERKDH